MLLEFTTQNYKPFKDKQVFSLIPSNYFQEELENLVQLSDDWKALKTAVIYGANGSGKSKFFDALGYMKKQVLDWNHLSNDTLNRPFLFHKDTKDQPTVFEVVFYKDKNIFRYGFELGSNSIEAEWFYKTPTDMVKNKETEIFYRENDEFEINDRVFKIGNKLYNDKMVRKESLFLSASANYNEAIAIEVVDWFKNLNIVLGNQSDQLFDYTIQELMKGDTQTRIVNLLQSADIPIDSLEVIDSNSKIIKTLYNMYSGSASLQKETISLDLKKDESTGTNKFFSFLGPILNTLNSGKVLFIDELEANLHPNLVFQIVKLFQSEKSNPKNAQLILSTHETNLLSRNLFRRDQIWLIDKDHTLASHLYSIADYKKEDNTKVRKDESFEKNYIMGRYGAVPMIDLVEGLLK